MEIALLPGIIVASAILRFWGLSFGLPYRYHPDEPQHVVEAARMLADRRLEPELFNNPPLFKYVLALADTAWISARLVWGDQPLPELIDGLQVDPSPLYLLGRRVSALAGVLTVIVVFLLADKAYGRRAALLASTFMAVAFLPVRDSHFAVNDSLTTLLVALSLLGAVRVAQRGTTLDYLLAGGSAGLAIATKYTAALVLVPLTIGQLTSTRGQERGPAWGRRITGLGALGGLVGFAAVVGSPYFLITPYKVIQGVTSSIYAYGRYGFEGWQIDAAGGYVYYLKSIWWGLGPGMVVLVLAGVAFAFRRHSPNDLILVSMPILFYLAMGRQRMYFARFLLPILPALLVLGAMAGERLAQSVQEILFCRKMQGTLLTPAFLPFVAVIALAPTFASGVRFDYLLSQTDTRTLAKTWIEQNIPASSSIAVDWPHHAPPLTDTPGSAAESQPDYEVLIIGGHGLADHPLSYYRALGIEYLITSSFLTELSLADLVQSAERDRFYQSLKLAGSLIHEIRPTSGGEMSSFVFDEIYGPAVTLWERDRPGPILRLYQLGQP